MNACDESGLAYLPYLREVGPDEYGFLCDASSCDLLDLARGVLQILRHHFDGELRRHEPSGRYVETEDNFVAFTVQPRCRALLVRFRGRIENFPAAVIGRLDVTEDRHEYYVKFKLTSAAQCEDFRSMLLHCNYREIL